MKRALIGAMSLTAMAALSPLLASSAYAQHYEQGFVHSAPRYETPHWAFDERFHHDHFYPVPGYAVATLPAGHLAVNFGGGRFFFHAGIVLPVLPPAYTTVWIAGAPYYYANDIYYSAVPGGYAVVEPPMDASAPPPQAAAAPAAGGSYYYCESTKSYYPYTLQCKEGWRFVPSTPPQTR
jgi:hypothetical protein